MFHDLSRKFFYSVPVMLSGASKHFPTEHPKYIMTALWPAPCLTMASPIAVRLVPIRPNQAKSPTRRVSRTGMKSGSSDMAKRVNGSVRLIVGELRGQCLICA
jgi:hypothetical protein